MWGLMASTESHAIPGVVRHWMSQQCGDGVGGAVTFHEVLIPCGVSCHGGEWLEPVSGFFGSWLPKLFKEV